MMESTTILGTEGQQCKNCIFFVEDDQEHFGDCHRHAPKPVVCDQKDYGNMSIHQPTIWPMVCRYEFCGEFVDIRQFHSYNK